MPTIQCPKCEGKLRLPVEFQARRVKCPSCGNVFVSSDGAASTSTSGSHEAPRARDSKDFELPLEDDRGHRSRREREDERERRPRRRDDDDYDDDRAPPRKRRYRDDDDDDDDYYEDRRSRRRYEDDDDDRRPRRRRYRDDDYDDRPRRKKMEAMAIEGQMNRSSLGCLLNFIGGWLQVGAFGMMAFVVFLHWCGIDEGLRIFTVIAGLLGLGYWLTSTTGVGFLVSGPRARGALGLSIATAGTAAFHLMLIIITATTRNFGSFGTPGTPRTTEVAWSAFVSQLLALPSLLYLEIAYSDLRVRIADGSFLPVMTNLTELARMVLFLLTLRAIMLCARDPKGASTCMKAMIGYAIGAGGLILAGVLFGLLMLGMRPDKRGAANIESLSAISHLFYLVAYLTLAGLAVGVTLIVKSTKNRLDYRR